MRRRYLRPMQIAEFPPVCQLTCACMYAYTSRHSTAMVLPSNSPGSDLLDTRLSLLGLSMQSTFGLVE